MRNISWIAVIGFALAGPTQAATPQTWTVELESDAQVVITQSVEFGEVAIEVIEGDKVVDGAFVENAQISDDDIRKAKLCASCEESVFVNPWDSTSTFGATTGFIIWRQDGWRITTLEWLRVGLDDLEQDGVFEIVYLPIRDSVEARFHFEDGNLVPL